MTPSYITLLSISIQAGLPVILWGGPGTGKTTVIKKVGEMLDAVTETVMANIREPTDFAGLPIITGDRVRMAPPDWAMRLIEAGKDGRMTIAFFDEISTAAPATQAALLRVILEGVVGDARLPANCARVAAANPPSQAAGGFELAPPLANRFAHLHWPFDLETWATGMVDGFRIEPLAKIKPDWLSLLPANRALITGFLRARPMLANALPTDQSAAGFAWPSPRSWDSAAHMLSAVQSAGLGTELRIMGVEAWVGAGASQEFRVFLEGLKLPPSRELLDDPASAIPSKFTPDQAWAMTSGCVALTLQTAVRQDWDKCWEVLYRIARVSSPDIPAFGAKMLANRRPKEYQTGIPANIAQFISPFAKLIAPRTK